MLYQSTRGQAPKVTADAALKAGAAPDGGLYLPEALPGLDLAALEATTGLGDLGGIMLAPFFADSPLDGQAPAICADAFNFPAPLVQPDPDQHDLQVLELFHGPTGAFKDFGARFLFRCFSALGQGAETPITVLVATSGDTGGAVGCAAEGLPGTRAVILFPKGRISAFQEHQLCCWEPPVEALRVEGDFDTCQALVKAAFADKALSAEHALTSANSISIGRLLPQMVYWARAALDVYAQTGKKPGLVIPTGNLGNALAALMARELGLPIGPVVLATNANATLAEFRLHKKIFKVQTRPAREGGKIPKINRKGRRLPLPFTNQGFSRRFFTKEGLQDALLCSHHLVEQLFILGKGADELDQQGHIGLGGRAYFQKICSHKG